MSEPKSIESDRVEVQQEKRLTDDAMQGDMKRCLESGCNDDLSKPIDARKFSEMFGKMIEQVE